jgi:hypothetical protein
VDAKDTAKFLEDLARQIKKLVANFMVRVAYTLLPLCIRWLTLRSSKAIFTSSRRSTGYAAL